MKAYLLKNNGGVENLVLSNIDRPVPLDHEVLVKVKAIGINPVDAAVRQNKQALEKIMQIQSPQPEGVILGWDISGTVVSSGKNVPGMDGKDVFGMVNFPGQGKAYAEYVTAPADQLAVKPAAVSFEEAAGATLAALTAWQALVTFGTIHEGHKVLIHAASGGVGHYAVQIAKFFGAYVIGIASTHNKSFVLNLGADEFIDYTKEKFEDRVKDADMILDSVNHRDHLLRSILAIKKGGRLISIKSYFDDELKALAKDKELYTERILVSSDGYDMEQIALLMEKGLLKSHISKVYAFKDLPKAHEQIETGKTRGKIVVKV